MKHEDEGFSPAERAALRGIEQDAAPERLRKATQQRLLAAGQLQRPVRRRWQWRSVSVAVAAGLLLFAAGRWSGQLGERPQAEGTRWMLLLRDGADSSEAVHQEHAARLRDWAIELAQSGVQVEGAPLVAEGWLYERGAVTELAGDRLDAASGYFLIGGVDAPRAQAIARSCPHLLSGGRVELRRLRG